MDTRTHTQTATSVFSASEYRCKAISLVSALIPTKNPNQTFVIHVHIKVCIEANSDMSYVHLYHDVTLKGPVSRPRFLPCDNERRVSPADLHLNFVFKQHRPVPVFIGGLLET